MYSFKLREEELLFFHHFVSLDLPPFLLNLGFLPCHASHLCLFSKCFSTSQNDGLYFLFWILLNVARQSTLQPSRNYLSKLSNLSFQALNPCIRTVYEFSHHILQVWLLLLQILLVLLETGGAFCWLLFQEKFGWLLHPGLFVLE